MSRTDDALGRVLSRWVGFALRHGAAVTSTMLVLSLLACGFAYQHLGFNMNPNQLFSDDLRFQQMIREFEEHFPQLTNSMLVVVDGETSEASREAASALARRLRARDDAVNDVYFPGEESFFEAHGLLYQSVDDLDEFTVRLAELQPVIGALSQDPSLSSLAWVVRNGLEQAPSDPEEISRLRRVLDHFREATVAVYAEYPVYVSWESVLLAGTPFDPETRRVLVVDPVLHFERILSAGPAMEAIREEAAALDLSDASVRITGYPALNHEEFTGLARDTTVAGLLSFALVLIVLAVAFRSWPVVLAAAVTLLVGFTWTAAYAAVFVGALNPASIAFAVLFIGLGVDFMIHLGMHFSQEVRDGAEVEPALRAATRDTGSALLLCALTTAIGFLAFLPTEYRGVSELGVISAGGMLVIVFQTLTLFPVLIHWGVRGGSLARLRARRPLQVPPLPLRRPGAVCAGAALLGVAGVWLGSGATLEANVIALRNPETESVETFMDLVESDRVTPWYADFLAPDLAAADALAERARELPEVARAVTVSDYVPRNQEEKLDMLADAAFFLELPLPSGSTGGRTSPAEEIASLRELVDFLGSPVLDATPGDLARSGRLLRAKLQGLLAKIDAGEDPQAAVDQLEHSLLDSIPGLTDRLRTTLETPGVAFEDLPAGLVDRMLAEDGSARVQVFPAEDLTEREAMVRFVESLRALSPDLTGLPVNLVESSYITRESLREALLWALLAIGGLLLVLWGRPMEVAIALAPLVLAVVLTAAATRVFDVSFNFINVCVLPLLLGIGVDSGVHMVHRARSVDVASGALLSTTTTQAVVFSSCTTLASFGTLVLSHHLGIASLGELLVIGMAFTLAGNLVLLPSLLLLWQRRVEGRGRAKGEPA